MEKAYTLAGHSFTIRHLEKVFFPQIGFTKKDVVDYYERIAGIALPYYQNRPVTLFRAVNGIEGNTFFQKDTPFYFSSWIERLTLPKKGGVVRYLLINTKATLVYVAGQACITPHLGLSQKDHIENPDRLILDLDPFEVDFQQVRQVALVLKDIFDSLNVTTFVQTTGSRGLHIIIPLDATENFQETRTFARELGDYLARVIPDDVTLSQQKKDRKPGIFIDTTRNAYGQTAVAPYAIRLKPTAPIATPLMWSELSDDHLHAQYYTVETIFERLHKVGDPWQEMTHCAQSLKEIKQRWYHFLKEKRIREIDEGLGL